MDSNSGRFLIDFVGVAKGSVYIFGGATSLGLDVPMDVRMNVRCYSITVQASSARLILAQFCSARGAG